MHIPSSPECGHWETLLVDAMDGLLSPEDQAVFSSHMASCASCTEMFEQVRRGRQWLEFLSPEPEVPAYLLDKILGDTGHGRFSPDKLAVASGDMGVAGDGMRMPPVWQRAGFAARARVMAEPRLLMTAAMAFFSIALTMSITGVRISAVHMSDLRPTAVRSVVERRIMTASTPLVRYYDHLRFVYEVESRMKELRRSTEMEQQQQQNQQNQQQGQPNGSARDGDQHRQDGGAGGSKLNPGEAPQQTVNPPVPLWNGDLIEARLEIENAAGGVEKTSGLPARIVLAMPDRSKRCIA